MPSSAWAIIRLIQRAGRVDRIGQRAEQILCYTFLPADGVEEIIQLRSRVRQRLHENAEVVGTDEAFFEDDRNDHAIRDLFTEKAGILDGEAETEVDLSSYAYQIWKNAIDRQPELQRLIPDLPNVVFSTKPHVASPQQPEGVLAFVRTAEGHDALAWLDRNGKPVTESQFAILRAAECVSETTALPHLTNHHELVQAAVELIASEERTVGGQLGRQLGFPTANIDAAGLVLPPNGVYAIHAQAGGRTHRAVLNIGLRPTLKNPAPQLRVEAHLLDFDGDLYGQEVEISFVEKLRDEEKFPSLEALQKQIAGDVARARNAFTA